LTKAVPAHDASSQIVDLYERHARAFDHERGKNLFERGWLDRFRVAVGAGLPFWMSDADRVNRSHAISSKRGTMSPASTRRRQ